MNQLTTKDGVLALHALEDEGGLSMAFDAIEVGDWTDLESDTPEWQVLGRSALGIVTGIDIAQDASRTVWHDEGVLYVPIEASAHNLLGEMLLDHIKELLDDHRLEPGDPVRWHNQTLAFGRMLKRGGLVQLNDEELEEALDEDLIAHGNLANAEDRGDIEIIDDTLTVPLEPWELVRKDSELGSVDSLLPMVQYGKSARAFAFEKTEAKARNERNRMGKFTVGSMLFSPGPFTCEVVNVITSGGHLPQIASAAWLDAHRSMGLRSEIPDGQRGRQVEVYSTNPKAIHSWLDARVVIRVYRADEGFDQSPLVHWKNMQPGDRQNAHFNGYGIGV